MPNAVLPAGCALLILMSYPSLSAPSAIVWRELPDLPQALGGHFVGVIDDHLVVAGGSYFTTPPWDGGKKIWVGTIYTYERGAAHWKLAGHLPAPLGYGAAIPVEHGLLLVGGQTPQGSTANVLRLTLQGGRVEVAPMPSLPKATTMFAAAKSGDRIYLAGGQGQPSSVHAASDFLSLPLRASESPSQLATWPGPPRILPLMAELGGYVYLVSGAELTGEAGPPVGRRFLTDVFRFRSQGGWEKMPPVPKPVQAGLALAWKGHLLVFGGNDGTLADREFELKEKHPGFSKDVLSFDPTTLRWSKIGEMPYSLVTTGITVWGGEWVIAGGEARPAHRSAKVIAGHLP